jgi:hypothetical protein
MANGAMLYILGETLQPAPLHEREPLRERVQHDATGLARYGTSSTRLTGLQSKPLCLKTYRGSGMPEAKSFVSITDFIASRQEPLGRIPPVSEDKTRPERARATDGGTAAEVPTRFCRLGQPW